MAYKLFFTVPRVNVAACKQAIFATGAGTYPGAIYDQVSFETTGTGQFRPLEGSNAHIGSAGKLEILEEVKVEVFCADKTTAQKAVQALKETHPYEQVAYGAPDVDQAAAAVPELRF